jgi:hypothetical protein
MLNMRTSFLLATLGLAGIASAQIPIPSFGFTYIAAQTRGYWFQAPPTAGVVIGISVPNEAAQAFQAIEFFDLGTTPPAAFPTTVNGTQLYYSNNTPAGSTVTTAIQLIPGNYYGVLGCCTATVGDPNSYNSYAAAAGTFASTILGTPTTLTRFGTQSGISAGGNNACFSEPTGTISRVELTIVPSGGTPATNATLGQGCGGGTVASFYEHFTTTPSIDLSNTAFQMLSAGSGYVVIPSTAAFVPPSATATNLNLTDDSEATVTLSSAFSFPGGTTNSLVVCSNGHVTTASNGAAFDYTPTPAEFLGWANPTWAVWRDMIPNATGNVWFEEVGGTAYITWNGVIGYVGTTPGTVTSTFQLQFSLSTGSVTFVFQSMDTVSVSGWAGGEGWIVGYSGPGASVDPTGTDLSALTSITLTGTDGLPLALSGATRPVTGTNWNLSLSNVPASGTVGIDVFGLTDPGINDLAFIGAPGCGLRASLDATSAWIVAGSTHAYSLAIPNVASLIGFSVFTTSVVFENPPTNAFGAITANGIHGTIGDV